MSRSSWSTWLSCSDTYRVDDLAQLAGDTSDLVAAALGSAGTTASVTTYSRRGVGMGLRVRAASTTQVRSG
jgi:hypothetical protein